MYKFDNDYETIALQKIDDLANAIIKVGDKFNVIENEVNIRRPSGIEIYGDDVYEELCNAFEDKRVFDHEPELEDLYSNEYQNDCEVVKFFLCRLVDFYTKYTETMKNRIKMFLEAYFVEPV